MESCTVNPRDYNKNKIVSKQVSHNDSKYDYTEANALVFNNIPPGICTEMLAIAKVLNENKKKVLLQNHEIFYDSAGHLKLNKISGGKKKNDTK